MSLSISRYVKITSAVAGALVVMAREMIGRIYTGSVYQSTDAPKEFTSDTAVANWFGGASVEYAIAKAYFGFVTKSATRASKISFSGFSTAASPARVITGKILSDWATVKAALTALGSTVNFGIYVGGVLQQISSGALAGYTSFANLAAGMQTSLAAIYPGATVTYQDNRFVLSMPGVLLQVSGDTRAAPDSSASSLIQLLSTQTMLAYAGQPARTPAQILADDVAENNNFFSYYILPTLDDAGRLSVASFQQSQNFMFMWCLPGLTPTTAATYAAALLSYAGIGVTVSPLSGEYPELLPMFLAAATDYSKRAANKNRMYYQMSGVTPSVTDDDVANTMDAARVNYYGQTQQAGKKLSFYQRGKLTGGALDAVDMNIYANEAWLKDLALTNILNAFLALEVIPATKDGAGIVATQVQATVDAALANGVITTGKTLTSTQKLYIQEQTGDPLAWIQVQSQGYWMDCTVVEDTNTGEYVAQYTLIYSKGDAVRTVEGSHQLI